MLKHQPRQKPLAKMLSTQWISGHSRELRSLIQSAEQLQTLDTVFNESVPGLYKNRFHTNGIKNRILTITCHSASLATRLRFDKKQIIENINLRLTNQPVDDIKIRIRPVTLTDNSGGTERILSKENAEMLLEEAEQVQDKKLKSVLIRLAQHVR